MKTVCVVCLLAFACTAFAKQKQHPIDPCDLQPEFSKSSASNENKARVNAELVTLNSDLINQGFDGEFSKTVDDTYQAIPEKDVACRLMIQEVQCVVTTRPGAIGKDIVTDLIKIVEQKKACTSVRLQELKQSMHSE